MKTLTALFLGAFLTISASARAEQVLLNNVAFLAQSPPGDWNKNLNCGPVSALMVAARRLNFTPTAEDTKKILNWLYQRGYITPQNGAEYYDGNITNVWHLEKILTDYFQLTAVQSNYDNNLARLKAELESGNPVIVGVNIQMDTAKMGHFMVVVGLNEQEIIVHDPGRISGAFNRYDLNQFHRSWQTSNYASLSLVSQEATWHPNGTLLKSIDDNKVYQLIDGKKYLIISEAVFNSHNFDWQKIITVSSAELNCYDYGGEIDWQPYRELFQVDGTIYLMERYSAESPNCAVYQFSSQLSYQSWNIPGVISRIDDRVAEQNYFQRCSSGGLLHLRAGTLIKPSFSLPDFGVGVIFVAENNGVLRPFANEAVYKLLKYNNLPIIFTADNQEFVASFSHYGEMITLETAHQCLNQSNTPISVDMDNDGYSVADGDCDDYNSAVNPGQSELCDNIDNNCDGRVDENLTRTCVANCGAGFSACQAGQWLSCQITEFNQEIFDGVDNNCNGQIDEGFENDIERDGGVINAGIQASDGGSGHENNVPDAGIQLPDAGCCHPDEGHDGGASLSWQYNQSIRCQIVCPSDMRAYVWYGAEQGASGLPNVLIDTTIEEICERGQPWLDFNCACVTPYEWACYDWTLAEVSCSHSIEVKAGEIDYRGEGEIWFTDFSCY